MDTTHTQPPATIAGAFDQTPIHWFFRPWIHTSRRPVTPSTDPRSTGRQEP